MSVMDKLKNELQSWKKKKAANSKNRKKKFVTTSSKEVKGIYTPADIKNFDYSRDLGLPGEYPFTRGVRYNMYRGRLWTMRQFAGFATPRDTNQRFHFLLNHGETGLSTAFDLPTLMGYDSDHPMSLGEVGVCGVAVDTLQDMEIIFDKIPLDQVSTSMTINSPAAILLAFYIAVGENQSVSRAQLRGTLQNDILKEYIAQKEYIFPPKPSMRIITDIMKFCSAEVKQWNSISISGYHIREAGSTAVQELAFTLADGFAYVEAGIEAGLDIDEFAPRLSFFFNAHLDFFEEIAKYRAARRIWARHMKERYKAQDPRSWMMRFHTQTAGCSLTAQQPENNIVRTAYEALAGVMGGTQSLHTNSMDETWALPSERAAKIALRTQQVLAHEIGVGNTIDPLAGSYFVEALTNEMEENAEAYFEKIENLGGVVPAIEIGYFQKEIAKAAAKYQEEIDEKERIIVGVNDFIEQNETIEIPLLKIDPGVEKNQLKNLNKVKAERNATVVQQCLKELRQSSVDGTNLMPHFIKCAKNYVSLGEMIQVLKEEFGEYQETAVF